METPTTDRTGARAGVVLVDKPAGMTSHDVVAIVRRSLGVRRVGHTGTLDPFATGLLVVLFGNGTRLIPYVEGEPKVYDATIRFGAETETDDRTGAVTTEAAAPADAAILQGIARLTGVLDQIPPQYSAKQVGGRRAYAAARAGDALELPPARVIVHNWTVLARRGDDLDVRITCGSGTYIRALARDLGRLTHSAAHLAALRRVRGGPFEVSSAWSLDDVAAGRAAVLPLVAAIPTMPVQLLQPDELPRVRHGNAVAAHGAADAGVVALAVGSGNDQTLIAIARRAGNELRPTVVLDAA